MIIDSIYSGNEDIACHHCIPIGIIRLSVINSLSNLNGSHTISSIPLFFSLSLFARRGGHFYCPNLSPPILQRIAIRERGSLFRNEKKISARCVRLLRKIRMFLGLVDHS